MTRWTVSTIAACDGQTSCGSIVCAMHSIVRQFGSPILCSDIQCCAVRVDYSWTRERWKCGSGKCRSDKVWKAIRRKYSKVPDEISANSKVSDEIWLSWLSCAFVAKRNSQASRPVKLATEVGTSKQCSNSWFDNIQHHNDDDASDDASTPTTVPAHAAVDFCEVCLVAPRDTRIALVPRGHQRFYESCAIEVHNQGRGCPLCRTPINMLLRLY